MTVLQTPIYNIPVKEKPRYRTIEPGSEETPSDIEEKLNLKHPEYVTNIPVWTVIRDFVEGAPTIISKAREYLPPFLGEDPESYSHRVSNICFTPILPKAVTTFVGNLSAGNIVCTSVSKSLQETIEVMEPMKYASNSMRDWLLYGVTVATYDVLGDVVIPQLLDPLTLINWGENPDGSLEFAVIKTRHTKSVLLSKHQNIVRWRVFSSTEMTVYEKVDDKKPEIVDRLIYSRVGCPVVRFKPPSEMWTASQAYLLQKKHTLLENTQLQAAWNLYIQRAFKPPQLPDSDLPDTYINHQIDTSNTHLVYGDFVFSEARGTSVQTNSSLLQEIEKQIRAFICMTPIDEESRVESGESKRYDYDELKSRLKLYGEYLRKWVELSLKLIAFQWGDTREDILEVSGLDRFEVGQLDTIITQAQAIEMLGPNVVPTAKTLFLIQLNTQIAGMQTKEVSENIEKEVISQIANPKPMPGEEDPNQNSNS